MKVAVDGYLFRHSTRGMVRFANTLASGLGNHVLTLEPPRTIATETYSHGFGKRPSFPYWEQWLLPRLALASGVDVLVCPYNTGPLRLPSRIRLVLVVHDLIFLDRSLGRSISPVQNVGRHYRRVVVPRVARKAFHIVTVSDYSKQHIMKHLGVPEFRITVIPNAIGEFWFEQAEKRTTGRPYILTVSGEAPSKNLIRLLEAFSQVHQAHPQLRLVVVGVKPSTHQHFQAIADGHGIAGEVTFTPFVSDEDLRCLYQNAELYVCASLTEGFGIPILEAMAVGVPLACSDRSSIPEVCGEAALYFDPNRPQSISRAILNALDDLEHGRARVEAGRIRASQFSEKNVAIKVSQFWRQFGAHSGHDVRQ